jgi:hypothetical protein
MPAANARIKDLRSMMYLLAGRLAAVCNETLIEIFRS